MKETKKGFKTYNLKGGWKIQRVIQDRDGGYGLVNYHIEDPKGRCDDSGSTLAEARMIAKQMMGEAS